MRVLVDSSVWIDYFRSGDNSLRLDNLINENFLVINDIIFAELILYLRIMKQTSVIKLLYEINQIPLVINWDEIITLQTKYLKNGANGIGIPDLIIAQNAQQNNCSVYSLGKHFSVLNQVLEVQIFNG